MKEQFSKEQRGQEEIYSFPYHYLTSTEKGNFTQSRFLEWGYEYQSYIDFVLSLLKGISFQTLLDVGCGDGRFMYEAKELYADKDFVGTDFSKRALSFARAFFPQGEYKEGDITDESLFSRNFDVVTLIETLEHIKIESVQAFIKGIAYYTKPGGTLIMTVPSTSVPVNPKHYQHFTLDTLSAAIAPYFTITKHYFLNTIGIREYIIRRLFSNRFFLLHEKHAVTALYNYYLKHLLQGHANTTKRICIIAKRLATR